MSQVYMTAKLNLADGTIIYPQISLDNVVKSISDPTLVTVATLDGSGDVPMSQLPYVTTIGNDATDTTIPTAAAVRGLANGLQPALTAADGIIIVNGSTIMSTAVNLNTAIIGTTASNGISLAIVEHEIDGQTASNFIEPVAALATDNSAGVIAGAADGVTLDQGVVKVNLGDGLLLEDNQIAIDEATVEQVLQGGTVTWTEGASGWSQSVVLADDKVDTPANLRGALSVGQAVDVSCQPYCTGTALTGDFLTTITWTGTGYSAFGFSSQGSGFPKFADGLKYLFIFDITNTNNTETEFQIAKTTTTDFSGLFVDLGPNYSTLRYTLPANGSARFAFLFWSKITQLDKRGGSGSFAVTNCRQYEVTALTDDAIAYLAKLPDPDQFFRSTSAYQIRDKYLIKQDMVCPFIPTIEMPDNSDLTVGAGLSYQIKYTSDTNPHNVTVDTIPNLAYGWDAHIQMFVKGAAYVNFQPPLVLMGQLRSNAGHNLSVKFRNGQAFVYVDDFDAGYVISVASGTEEHTLYEAIAGGTHGYAIFANGLDGTLVDGGTATYAGGASGSIMSVLGNGTDKTLVTGTFASSGDRGLSLQAMTISGGTLGAVGYTGALNLREVVLEDCIVSPGSDWIRFYDVTVPESSTLTVQKTFRIGNITVNGVLDMAGVSASSMNSETPMIINGTGTINFTSGQLTSIPLAGCSVTGVTVYKTGGNGADNAVGYWGQNCVITNAYIENTAGCGARPTEVYGSTIRGKGSYGAVCIAARSLIVKNSLIEEPGSIRSFVVTTTPRNAYVNVSIEGSTFSGYAVWDATRSTVIMNMSGRNRILSGCGSSLTRYWRFNFAEGSVVDFTGNTYPNDLVLPHHESINCEDNVSIITVGGSTVNFDSCSFKSLYRTGRVSYPGENIIIKTTNANPWKADGVIFGGPFIAAGADIVKLTGTSFKDDSTLSACSRLQLPAGSEVSFQGSTVAADTHILEAALIVVGDDPTSPSGSATVVNASGASVTVSGIGTYIDKEGDNDLIATTKVVSVGTSADFMTALTATTGADGTNRFIKLVAGSTVATSFGDVVTNISDKRVLASDYSPLFGGVYSLTSSSYTPTEGDPVYAYASITVDEANKVVTQTDGRLLFQSGRSYIGKGVTLKLVKVSPTVAPYVQLDGYSGESYGTKLGGGGVIDCNSVGYVSMGNHSTLENVTVKNYIYRGVQISSNTTATLRSVRICDKVGGFSGGLIGASGILNAYNCQFDDGYTVYAGGLINLYDYNKLKLVATSGGGNNWGRIVATSGSTVDISGYSYKGYNDYVLDIYTTGTTMGYIAFGDNVTIMHDSGGDLEMPKAVHISGGTFYGKQLKYDGTLFGPVAFPSGSTISGDATINLRQTNIVIASGETKGLSGLTITGGLAQYGGGIDVEGTATISSCYITGCTCTSDVSSEDEPRKYTAGGIDVIGTATITGCTVTGCTSANGPNGGVHVGTGATATISNCIITDNFRSGTGSTSKDFGINGGTASLSGSTVGHSVVNNGVLNVSGTCKFVQNLLGNGVMNVAANAVIDLKGNTNGTPIQPTGGIVVATGGCKVINTSGSTVTLAAGTYATIKNDGTTTTA